MKRHLALLVLFTCMLFLKVHAQEFVNLSTEELKKMMDTKTKMLLVDARDEIAYREGHLPKAINIPPDRLYMIEKLLPKEKNSLIVFYCWSWG